MNTPKQAALQYHTWGANVTAIKKGDKSPAHKWKHLHSERQPRNEVLDLPFGKPYVDGVGIINGPSGWHTLDIDALMADGVKQLVSDATINTLLDLLHLPHDYPWVWRGQSGAGWALAFLCTESLPPGVLPAKKDEAGVAWGWPAKDSAADWHHIEVRWATSQTVLPPTSRYQWRGNAPSEPPAEVPLHRILAAFFALCPASEHTIGSLDDATKEAIRERFDLVDYAVQHFGGETQREGDEIRVLGHGGMLINEARGIWNCFSDEIGGDCFELVAYKNYRTVLKNLNGKSAAIVKEAAAFAGVTLPERKPEQTVTDTPLHTDTATDMSVVSVESVARFIIRTEDDLANLPPLQWLQPDELLGKGYHLIYGASGSGKTFYAIRRAMLSAEAGRRVLYVATEDLTGLKHRVAAWRRAFPEAAGTRLTWLDMPQGLDLQDAAQVDELLSAVRGYGYEHIVIDTLREAHSGDENSSQDGAAINRAIQRIIRETGAAVDVVHHSGVEDRRPRGTTAIFGNADMVLRVSKDEEIITLHYDKIRNSAPLEDKVFALTNAATDCLIPVLRPIDNYTRRDAPLGRVHKAILETLAYSIFAETGAKTRALLEATDNVNERQLYRALSDLKDKGYVSQSVKGDPYYITSEGRAQLLPQYVTATDTTATAVERPTDTTDNTLTNTAVSSSDTPSVLTDTDTTLKGVSVSQWSQSVTNTTDAAIIRELTAQLATVPNGEYLTPGELFEIHQKGNQQLVTGYCLRHNVKDMRAVNAAIRAAYMNYENPDTTFSAFAGVPDDNDTAPLFADDVEL